MEDDDIADAAFELPVDVDDDWLHVGELRSCPEHGTVLPIVLPYVKDRDAEEPQGYHSVCPRCRHAFEEYEVDGLEWEYR